MVSSYISGAEISQSLKTTLKVLLFPFLQIVFLRLMLKYGLDVRIGWQYATDYDFFLPIPIAAWLTILVLSRATQLKLRFSAGALILNLLLMVAFLLFCARQDLMRAVLGQGFFSMWFGFLICLGISAVNVVLDYRLVTQNPNRWVLIPACLIAISVVTGDFLVSRFWAELSHAAGAVTNLLVGWVGDTRYLINERFGGRVVLKHSAFAISIGKRCGGMDAFLLFWQLGLVACGLFGRSMRLWQWLLFFIFGTLLMYVLNGVRIAGLFLTGVFLSNAVSYSFASDYVMLLFHLHTGWILYTLALVVYFRSWAHVLSLGKEMSPAMSLREAEEA